MDLLIKATPHQLLLLNHLPALPQASSVQSRHRWLFSNAVIYLVRVKRREASSSKEKSSSKNLGPVRKTNKGFTVRCRLPVQSTQALKIEEKPSAIS